MFWMMKWTTTMMMLEDCIWNKLCNFENDALIHNYCISQPITSSPYPCYIIAADIESMRTESTIIPLKNWVKQNKCEISNFATKKWIQSTSSLKVVTKRVGNTLKVSIQVNNDCPTLSREVRQNEEISNFHHQQQTSQADFDCSNRNSHCIHITATISSFY